jgi:hypothetical protein
LLTVFPISKCCNEGIQLRQDAKASRGFRLAMPRWG